MNLSKIKGLVKIEGDNAFVLFNSSYIPVRSMGNDTINDVCNIFGVSFYTNAVKPSTGKPDMFSGWYRTRVTEYDPEGKGKELLGENCAYGSYTASRANALYRLCRLAYASPEPGPEPEPEPVPEPEVGPEEYTPKWGAEQIKQYLFRHPAVFKALPNRNDSPGRAPFLAFCEMISSAILHPYNIKKYYFKLENYDEVYMVYASNAGIARERFKSFKSLYEWDNMFTVTSVAALNAILSNNGWTLYEL